MPEQAWICGIGMVTPLGDCSAQTVSSVRAGINRYQMSPVYNKRFEPMTLALLPEDVLPPLNDALLAVPGLTSRQTRMLRLADPALREALQTLPKGVKVPLFMAVPEQTPGRPHPVTYGFLDHLILQTGLPIERGLSRLTPTGRAGVFFAISAALEFLDQHPDAYVLVGGVDTYLDLHLLGTLDQENRVLANGVMDGFAPGEGAGVLLLCTEQLRASKGLDVVAKVHKPGMGVEPGHRYSEKPYQGDGLADSIRAALEQGAKEPVRSVFTSLNGENFGAKEWGVSVLRNSAKLDPGFLLQHPADGFGDTGAGAGPVLIGLAATGLRSGHISGPALVWCASEGQHRGAVCVSL